MFGGIKLVGVHDSHLISGFLWSNFSLDARVNLRKLVSNGEGT
jgi:hypothetical protein